MLSQVVVSERDLTLINAITIVFENVLGWVQEGGELNFEFFFFETVKTIFTNWKDLTNLNDEKYNVQQK